MKYVIYARKSSENEDRQALSIESQIIEMKEIAKRENLDVVEIFQESKSAKEPGRPIFELMVNKFKKGIFDSPDINGITTKALMTAAPAKTRIG